MKRLAILALAIPVMALAQSYPSPTFSGLTLQTPLTAANGGTGTTTSTGTGSVVLSSAPTLANPVISGGTIDNASIGATTPSTGAFTSLSASGTVSGAGFSTLLSSYATLSGSTFTGQLSVKESTPLFVLNDASGASYGDVRYQSNGTMSWALRGYSSGVWSLNRYTSGTLADSPISVSNSTGTVTFADGITANGTVSGSGFTSLLSAYAPLSGGTFTGAMTLGYTTPVLNLKDTSGSGYSELVLSTGASTYWLLRNVSSSGLFRLDRYVSGSFTDSPLTVSNATGIVAFSDGLSLPESTVASLPSCTSSLSGVMRAVTDATSPTYNGSLTGGGAVVVPVFCNGSSWTAH